MGCIITLITFVRSFISMNSHMSRQMGFHGCGVITYVTFKRFFASMTTHMYRQATSRSRGIITNITFVGFRASMYTHMYRQITFRSRGILTNIAFVWFLASMTTHMCRQTIFPSCGIMTNITLVSFLVHKLKKLILKQRFLNNININFFSSVALFFKFELTGFNFWRFPTSSASSFMSTGTGSSSSAEFPTKNSKFSFSSVIISQKSGSQAVRISLFRRLIISDN